MTLDNRTLTTSTRLKKFKVIKTDEVVIYAMTLK